MSEEPMPASVQSTEAPPRELPEIEKDFEKLTMEAGKHHYQMNVYKTALSQTTEKLYKLNLEAVKRRALNAQQEKAKNAVQ